MDRLMTPKPESETDPWAKVRTFDVSTYGDCRMERDYYGEIASEQKYQRGEYAWVDEVDAARAAEAAQHQQEIAAKDETIAQLEENIARQAGYMLAADARLAAVEAERDQAQRALATAYLKARRQASVCEPNEDQFAGAMAVVAAAFPNTRVEATAVRIAKPEEPTELVVAVKRRAERAEAERDRLKAALTLLWREVVASGNAEAANHGWPEAKRAVVVALTTQHQSTDGSEGAK